MSTKLAAVAGLVLLLAALNAAGVESQRLPPLPPGCHYTYDILRRLVVTICDNPTPSPPAALTSPSMFVFGDSFADNGNLPKDTQQLSLISRQWYDPYGASYGQDNGTAAGKFNPTGRFSNYLVQSDFIGRILGMNEAPPTYISSGINGNCDNAGMTFAAGGSGVFPVPLGVPTLSDQLDNFERLVASGCITKAQIDASVVLIAVSGNDYDRVGVAQPSAFGDVTVFIRNVTSQIAAAVDRLEKVGVNKILVNNLHPVGCTPAQTVLSKYATCDGAGNTASKTHNENLHQLLADNGNVMLLDLYGAFIGIVDKEHAGNKGSDLSRQFKNKKTPCCVGNDPTGFCGQMSSDAENPVELYTVCPNPEKHFFWDEMNPTQAGWTAIMTQLEGAIRQFIWPSQS
ncbi:GDSL esterase/lipase At5g03610-like [Lolium perenne]|uniref:GDSL esterase/lipase At5g03610-like n=1 Tax=Lolium perenne TaxID=4522 RepID=UPI0021F5DF62|nr:GDSL esterase/lipase At3g09930-like [Lolium perenne]